MRKDLEENEEAHRHKILQARRGAGSGTTKTLYTRLFFALTVAPPYATPTIAGLKLITMILRACRINTTRVGLVDSVD